MSASSEQAVRPASHSSLAFHTYSYFNAHQAPDGSLLHAGPKQGEGYHYIAPDGTHYQRNWAYNEDGSPTGVVGHGVTGPVVNGKVGTTLTVINHASRTYSQEQTEYSDIGGANAPESQAPGLGSSPSEVQQALRSGQAAQEGTATVDGTPAVVLSVTVPGARNLHRTLYVDTRTYQPLRTVTFADGKRSGACVTDLMPATPGNAARAKGDSVPVGYTKVDMAVALRRA